MTSMLRTLWNRLFGGVAVDPEEDPVDYNGYLLPSETGYLFLLIR
jgi:hypothetical protein